MRNITVAAMMLGICKLVFSTAVLAWAEYRLGLPPGQIQTLSFATLVFGAQAVLYVVRERRPLWTSRPGKWVLAASASAVDIAIVCLLALSGSLMATLPWRVLGTVLIAACVFALLLDQIKLIVISVIRSSSRHAAHQCACTNSPFAIMR